MSGINPVTGEPWELWEIESLIGHIQSHENAPWLAGWSPMQQKLMVDGLQSLRLQSQCEAALTLARQDVEELVKMLHTCRQEFCWHGNTGKSLSANLYGEIVDKIDAALAKVRKENHDGS